MDCRGNLLGRSVSVQSGSVKKCIVHIEFILLTKKLSIMTPKTERGFCYEKAFQ